jgi:hypothetical protein
LDKIDRGPFSLSDWLQKPPVLVGIGTVSGAVVATLITLLAVRKKRGASALAMVSGDVKKVGGEMPLANGSKTDDFERS